MELLKVFLFAMAILAMAHAKQSKLAGGLRGRLASDGPTKGHNIQTYVINMDSRKERCQCMQQILSDSPSAVYRQPAVTLHQCAGFKNDPTTVSGANWQANTNVRNHTAERSLMCSNIKAWEQALANKADFVVVMEDDIGHSPEFWPTIQSLVNNCNGFDFISLDAHYDTYAGEKPPKEHLVENKNVCGASDLGGTFWKPTKDRSRSRYWGTAAQIIRGSFLPELISIAKTQGMGATDHWWQLHLVDKRAFAWVRGLVGQVQDDPKWGGSKCADVASIASSDIGPLTDASVPVKTLLQSKSKVNDVPRLQCLK